jgi:hypothetical protein
MNENRARERTRGRPIPNEPDHEDRPGRVPPHSIAAEESLLGAAMLSKAALEVLATRTDPSDFYKPAHGHIAHVLKRAFEEGWPPDAVTVAAELEKAGLLDAIGGPATLATILASTPSTTSAPRYATIVHDHATLRRVLAAGTEIAELGWDGGDAHAAVLKATELLGTVASQNGSRAYSSLDVADVTALLDGDLEVEEPDFLRRNDGRALFYAGKMHVLQAEPSSGKSWLALVAALEVLNLGGAVLYLDYEDTSTGILGRLLALGAEPAAVKERFAYVQPVGAFGPPERVELERILARLNPDFVVIDGVAEALARDGLSEDKASEVVGWIEKLPRWLARTGAAVVMLDHVVKDREQQGRWARGSGAKLGAVDGATYLVKVTSSFSRHRAGTLKLVIAKDRPGGVGAIGETAAIATIEPKADGTRVLISLARDTGEVSRHDSWKPTVLMRKVSEELFSSSVPLTASALKNLVHSDKPKLVSEAISRLIVEGYVLEKKRGRSTILVPVKAYDDGSNPPGPPEPPPELPLDDDPSIDPETGRPYDLGELLEEPPSNVRPGPWPGSDPDDPVGF